MKWADRRTKQALKDAAWLVYRALTTIEGNGGMDGELRIAQQPEHWSLDIWTSREVLIDEDEINGVRLIREATEKWQAGKVLSIYGDHALMLPVDQVDRELIQDAVHRFVLDFIGREDLVFEWGE